ncbi:hypothetical protein ARALYDRAFT_890483 [Arabidopsis lyrata subsp. lyrata]|uniref:C3H1-type domain-containing protein n=1 Tax=Arabidopsis lyrata subsp. lyrata TaxID=81972 RepID=D7KDV2_ARALL|nr:hypothetical protein ARALYDRAFT_890483 [Arabidopsis lyrata subsp. lyrata]
MADAGDNQRRSAEKESKSIEETKENEDLGSGINDTGHHVYYYNQGDEEVREYLKQERLKDVEMRRRRHETESRSIEKTKGTHPDERTDRVQKTDSRSLPEKKGKEDSVLRKNEAGQIHDYKHSTVDTRECLPQQRQLRDVVGMHRRRRETESRFWHQGRDRSPIWRENEYRMRFDERTQDWLDSDYESRWRVHERTPDWDWRDSESRMRFDERTQDRRGSESQWVFDERTQRRHEPVRPGEECWCLRCRNGRSCRYNHPTQLPQYFRRGYCKLGSFCKFQHIRDRDVAETMYQDWRFDERTHRRHEIEYSGFRPEKREIREHENPQKQIQRNTERQGTVAQDNVQFHQQQEEEMQRPQSHTTQQQQSVQQHQLLASHFNLYPLAEKLTDVIEAGTRDQNSDALIQRNTERQRMVNRAIERQDMEPLIDAIVRGIMQERREKEANLQQQRLQEIRENHSVDAHDQQKKQELGFK